MGIENVLDNTKNATEQWNIFTAQCEDVESFKKAFHVRPTSAKKQSVTIVSTLKSKPMRGKHVGKTVVAKHLAELNKILASSNELEINKKLTDYGFKERANQTKGAEEEKLQAKMIREMETNQSLKDYLQVNSLYFIASEFILEDDTTRKRLDIIGYDGNNRVFFFELKAPENKNDDPVEQVKNYWLKYGNTMRVETLKVLSNYPNKQIKGKDIIFEGYAVIGYSNQVDKANSKIARINEKEPGVIVFIKS